METSKSTLTVAQEALKAGQESLPDYRYRKSPHKFTQPQLFACLVVKEFRRLDYRGIWVLLLEWPELRKVLGLTKVPHYTTVWAAGKRLRGKPQAAALLNGVLERCRQTKVLGKRTPLAAMDSTGLETRHVSACYTQRCQRHEGHYKNRYPKLSAIGDTASHLILGCLVDRGPTLDITEAQATVQEAISHQPLGALLGDAAYEAEGFHRFCREELGIRSIIPTTDRGRPRADGQPHAVRGRYRRLMKSHFPKVLYGQRWQVETIISMLKRNFGSALRARSHHSQNREIRLRMLTHDLGLLLRPLCHPTSHQLPACSIQSRCVPDFPGCQRGSADSGRGGRATHAPSLANLHSRPFRFTLHEVPEVRTVLETAIPTPGLGEKRSVQSAPQTFAGGAISAQNLFGVGPVWGLLQGSVGIFEEPENPRKSLQKPRTQGTGGRKETSNFGRRQKK